MNREEGGGRVEQGGERTKVNAAVLGVVHCVIIPFALLTKGTALAPDDEKQESRKAIATTTAMLNMVREEGGNKERTS